MPGSNIFDLGDQFGVSSPFGDWLSESQQARAAEASRRAALLQNPAPTSNFKRLMFYGGATSSSHNNTFLDAANNVNRNYSVKAKKKEITAGGQQIVDAINKEGKGKIQSIDIFSHGGHQNLYFRKDTNGNYQDLYRTDSQEQAEGTGLWPFGDRNKYGADIGEIDYGVFTDSAKVEFHGCSTASVTTGNKGENFASTFSKYLTAAGKKKAVVVGHIESTNPNAHRTLSGSDYRHGTRRVYHGGKVLFLTRQEGRITATTINNYLSKKAQQGSSYDGTKEKTWK